MIYTNDKLLIHKEGDIDALEASIQQLEDYLQNAFPGIAFQYLDDPFPHYLIPKGVTFDHLKNILGDEVERRPINEKVFEITERTFARQVKYWFTNAELEIKADELVNNIKSKDEVELKKKATMAALNEEIKKLEEEISKLAQQRRERFEMRTYDCIKQLNLADKKVYFVEGEKVRDVDELSLADHQLFINFDLPKEGAGPPITAEEMAQQIKELEELQGDRA